MSEPRELTPLPGPPPGLARLRRRLADRLALRDDLLFRLAATPDPARPGKTLGDSLDVAGDPTVTTVAELWSRVADGVCAYSEMTSGEVYLGTAQDWTDVRRVVDLVGYRPAQRTAAQGWIRADTAPGASPLIPAGTQVQAPGTPGRPAQTYEVADDTQLRADWAGLTVTGVPAPTAPRGSQLRFLADPGFGPPDRVVFVAETGAPPLPTTWWDWLLYWIITFVGGTYVGITGQAVCGSARITKRTGDLGAVLLDFDRSLAKPLAPAQGTAYAAYRVRAELTVPSRLDALSYVSDGTGGSASPVYPPGEPGSPYGAQWVFVTDGSDVSPGQQLILYGGTSNNCLVTTVTSVTPADWHVAPGTVRRVATVNFADQLPTDLQVAGTQTATALTVLVTDPRTPVQHFEFPDLPPAAPAARLYPRPAVLPALLAVQTQATDGTSQWELSGCDPHAQDTLNDPGGMLFNLTGPRAGTISRSAATANLAPVRHGATSQGPVTLTGGTAVLPVPVTGDVAADGTVADSLVLSVGGVRWDEVPTLYGRGPGDLVYTTRLAADGRLVLLFGDGVTGARPLGTVTATWRAGGGLAGEVPAPQISTLTGSVTGVRKITGAGVLSGAADQEDPLRMRRAAAARIRALDRAVALPDLADLALTVPGTSHSVSWRGPGPSGCACGGHGIHVAVLRLATAGVRVPSDAELSALGGYLDARRDTTVPICVCAAVPTPLTVRASVAVDPRRDPAAVLTQVAAALADPAGQLAPLPRDLGVPLDVSDVIEIAQPVPGVVGVVGLRLRPSALPPDAALLLAPRGDMTLGRWPARVFELLYVAATELGVFAGG
jgi:hypothetical protein